MNRPLPTVMLHRTAEVVFRPRCPAAVHSPGWSLLMCFFSSDEVTKLELHCGCEHLYGVSPGTHRGREMDGPTNRRTEGRSLSLSLTCVFAGVGDERGRDGEGHAAQVALVRPLAGVPPLVVGERAGLGEGLAAHITHVGLLAAVQPDNTQHTSETKAVEPTPDNSQPKKHLHRPPFIQDFFLTGFNFLWCHCTTISLPAALHFYL